FLRCQMLHRYARLIDEAIPGNAGDQHVVAACEEERRELDELAWAVGNPVNQHDYMISPHMMCQQCRATDGVDRSPVQRLHYAESFERLIIALCGTRRRL